MSLEDYGWNAVFAARFAAHAAPDRAPARVIAEQRGQYRLRTAGGELSATISGRLRREGEFPAVGDWVVCASPADAAGATTISAVLPRHSALTRKVAGARAAAQVIAANVDLIFVVMGLDNDFNLRRIERYLALAHDGGVAAVVLLSKADLVVDPAQLAARVDAVQAGALVTPVHAISSVSSAGLEAVSGHLAPARTVALLGSSGAGKSTLINRLRGDDALATAPVRTGDDRGRHTTTSRQLLRLDGGALLIDNPGLRELSLWGDGHGVSLAFGELDRFARRCRFADCAHEGEPGCAVAQAVADGALAPERLAAYQKLQRETRYLETRRDEQTRRAADRRFAKLCRSVKQQRKRSKG